MTRTATILKAMQAVLLVTVFTPAPLFAEPALTARQMLAQAQIQSQDNAVKGEVKKITSRGLILTDAQAAEPANPNPQRPVVKATIPAPLVSAPIAPAPAAVTKVDTAAPTPSTTEKVSTSSFEVAAAPVTPAPQAPVATSSIVILPAPPVAADTATPETVTKTDTATSMATIPAQINPVARAASTVQAQPSVTEATMPAPASSLPVVAATKGAANDAPKASNATDASVAPATKKAVASTETVATHRSSGHSRRSHPDYVFQIGNAKFGTQLKHILNRPEVKLLLAQYGLDGRRD
jgi:hypothetical protein